MANTNIVYVNAEPVKRVNKTKIKPYSALQNIERYELSSSIFQSTTTNTFIQSNGDSGLFDHLP